MELRRVLGSDAVDFYLWWNDRTTRMFSGDGQRTSWEKHLRWFGENIQNPWWLVAMVDGQYIDDVEGRRVYVNGRSIGAARIDDDPIDHRAWISINLDPRERGKGYGTELIRLATDRYQGEQSAPLRRAVVYPGVQIRAEDGPIAAPPVYARIHKLNAPSIRAFEKAGYVKDAEDGVWLIYRKG